MKRSILPALALLTIASFGFQTISAQLPRIPRIPRPDQPKPTPTPAESSRPAPTAPDREALPAAQPQPAASGTTTPTSAAPAQTQLAVDRDWVQFEANTISNHKGNYDVWSWVPRVAFRTTGSRPSGSHYYVEVTQPGSAAKWLSMDCESNQRATGYECGYWSNAPEDKSITTVGPVTFNIKLRNELAGTDATLFTGKAKVEKARSNEHGPKAVNKLVYYVNHDWALPIGYAYITPHNQDLNVSFWVRGEGVRMEPHLFYKGEEVGIIIEDGARFGAPSCGSDVEITTSRTVEDGMPQKAKWTRVNCSFPSIKGRNPGGYGAGIHYLDKNPGEYEFKVLWNKRLARTIKFTVGPDGRIGGIASFNDRMIVPVQIVGDQDGTWDRAAWRADAFYGNPLTGFSAQ